MLGIYLLSLEDWPSTEHDPQRHSCLELQAQVGLYGEDVSMVPPSPVYNLYVHKGDKMVA